MNTAIHRKHIVVTPSFAVGGYRQGHGKDLGHPPVLGRSGLDLEYRLDNEMRIGAAYYHMSNGKALDEAENPGAEIVGPTISVPFRQLSDPMSLTKRPPLSSISSTDPR